MLNANRIQGNLTNGKIIHLSKDHTSKKRDYELTILLRNYEGRIRLEIEEYDANKIQDEGWYESEEHLKRKEMKFFKTIPEAIDYILKTTIITEADFPAKYQQRVSKEAKR